MAGRWRSLIRRGDLECVITDHFVHRGATVVDIGASWGFFSHHMAQRVSREGLVISFEPHPLNTPILQKLEKARSQVRFRPVAASDAPGQAPMYVPRLRFRPVTAQSSLSHEFRGFDGVETDSISVPTVRLDDEIGPDARVTFMKVDVEGHELSVLRGAISILERCRPVLLIEIEQRHIQEPIFTVFDAIRALGYELFYVNETDLRPVADFDLERDQLSKVNVGNFNAFSMQRGYVNDFVAVADAGMLDGLPVRI